MNIQPIPKSITPEKTQIFQTLQQICRNSDFFKSKHDSTTEFDLQISQLKDDRSRLQTLLNSVMNNYETISKKLNSTINDNDEIKQSILNKLGASE